jgi:hypothetical protein
MDNYQEEKYNDDDSIIENNYKENEEENENENEEENKIIEEENENEEENEEENKIIEEESYLKPTFMYDQIIKNIFFNMPVINHEKIKDVKIQISRNKYIIYPLKFDKYIWLILQSINRFNKITSEYENEGLVDIVYKILEEENYKDNLKINNCKLKITLYIPDNTLIYGKYITSFKPGNFKINQRFKNKIAVSFHKFIEYIYNLTNNCKFLSLPVYIDGNQGGHATMLFLEKYNDKIIANYYEPSIVSDWEGNTPVNLFISNLEKESKGLIK